MAKCMNCGSIVSSLLSTCPICGGYCGEMQVINPKLNTDIHYIENFNNIDTLGEMDNYIKSNKVYILAHNDEESNLAEIVTYLIDKDKKTKLVFWWDGYEGTSVKEVKMILEFLGIKYFECVCLKLPAKYEEY